MLNFADSIFWPHAFFSKTKCRPPKEKQHSDVLWLKFEGQMREFMIISLEFDKRLLCSQLLNITLYCSTCHVKLTTCKLPLYNNHLLLSKVSWGCSPRKIITIQYLLVMQHKKVANKWISCNFYQTLSCMKPGLRVQHKDTMYSANTRCNTPV